MTFIEAALKIYWKILYLCLLYMYYVEVYKYQWKSMFQAVKFDLVRVDSPLGLVINGKKANTEFQAGIQLSTFTKSDWFKLITLVTM